jgi:DNA-binding transcriptional MerR regulator
MTFGAIVRQGDGLLSQTDVCKKLGISVQHLRYWQGKGRIPVPSSKESVGVRKYYTPNEMQVIKKFFAQGEIK